jgi:hypothetical protein
MKTAHPLSRRCLPVFIRKEDMDERLPLLAEALKSFWLKRNLPVDLIIPIIGMAQSWAVYSIKPGRTHRAYRVPHSVGTIRKERQSREWADLRIDEGSKMRRTSSRPYTVLPQPPLLSKARCGWITSFRKDPLLPPALTRNGIIPIRLWKITPSGISSAALWFVSP